MAFSASGRFSSEYHTASSFDPQNEALNSTVAFNDNTQGSADMSIEVGRGAKRTAREDELSEDGIFTFGSDQQYEMTGTPPLKPRDSSVRRSEGTLRRDATVRKASEVAKANESVRRTTSLGGKKQNSLADALKANADHTLDNTMQPTVTVPARNTRFTRFTNPANNNGARILSGSTLEGSNPENKDPSRFRPAQKNTTVHSTGSFLIPDIDGMTQLIGGTPAMPRSAKKSSRFTPSASYRMPSRSNAASYLPLDGVPVPGDAKQVYAGVEEAIERIRQLEDDKVNYEVVITDLREQLESESRVRRPASALGSEAQGSKDQWRRERAHLQNQAKSLQDRLDVSEHQTNVQEAAIRRGAQEREEIISQVTDAIYDSAELKAENETFRESYAALREENEDLKQEVADLREENEGMKALMAKAKRSDRSQQIPVKEMEDLTLEMQQKKQKSKKRSSKKVDNLPRENTAEFTQHNTMQGGNFMTFSQLDERARDSIALAVQKELQKIQETAKARAQTTTQQRTTSEQPKTRRSTSQLVTQAGKSHERRVSASASSRRAFSAPVESSASEGESESEAELAQRTRGTLRDMTLPSSKNAKHAEDDTADLTGLSKASLDPVNVRKFLEEERRLERTKRHSSAPLGAEREPTLTRDVTKSAPLRKSSLRDITSGLQLNATGRFSVRGDVDAQRTSKTVRVQSPHTSDFTANHTQQTVGVEDAEPSVASNITRRRRRAAAAGAEDEVEVGETSAFIIPDITMHNATTTFSGAKLFGTTSHKAGECTICAETNGNHIDIPLPIPVSTRNLGEDATLRPAWAPHLSLAHVLKQLEDEVIHLKIQLAKKQAEYNAHDPAQGRRRRTSLSADIDKLQADVDKRSEMVYRLYDVVEAQKSTFEDDNEQKGNTTANEKTTTEHEIEETLQSIGMDPAEVAGRIGRSAPDVPEGLQEEYSGDESEELPWEGLSDSE